MSETDVEAVIGNLEEFKNPFTKEAIALLRSQAEQIMDIQAGYEGSCAYSKQLEEQIESLSKDAERYRWLRDANGYDNNIGIFFCSEDGDMDFPNEVMADIAIDAALAAKE